MFSFKRLSSAWPGRGIRFLWGVVAVALLLVGCGGPAARGSADPLYVAAAANLATALPDVNRAFRAATGIPVTPVWGSSGTLAQQIANGAPYDVFLSANESYVDDLIAQGHLVAESKRIYALGTLALVVAVDREAVVASLTDLTRPEVERIALANPDHAPYGQAAVEALRRAGVWSQVTTKVVMGENVRQALQFVQTGNADAGLVAAALLPAPGVVVRPVPQNLYTPVRQAAAVVARSASPEGAQRFLAFLTGPEGQAILRQHGYRLPGEGP